MLQSSQHRSVLTAYTILLCLPALPLARSGICSWARLCRALGSESVNVNRLLYVQGDKGTVRNAQGSCPMLDGKVYKALLSDGTDSDLVPRLRHPALMKAFAH